MGYKIGGIELLSQTTDNQRKSNYWTIIYIKEGYGMYMIGSRLLSLNNGEVLILPPTTKYSFDSTTLGDEYNENLVVYAVRFDEGWLDDLTHVFPDIARTALNIKEFKNPLLVTGMKWLRVSQLLDSLARTPEIDRPQKMLDLLGNISGKEDTSPIIIINQHEEFGLAEKIENINNYISCNLCKKISLEEVATYINMNKIYFCTFFKSHFKEGFADYINRKRIEKARGLLSSTDKDIPTIASECGFKTLQYFTRVFTKYTGITPGKYLKTAKKEKRLASKSLN